MTTGAPIIDLSVGTIIDYGESISNLSWEDIILSESEDFWSTQLLDSSDLISIELSVVEVPSSVETHPDIFGEAISTQASVVDSERPSSEGASVDTTDVDCNEHLPEVPAGPARKPENEKR